MIVEADLELIEDSFSAKNIEADSKTFRESDRGSNMPLVDFDGEVVKICRDKASVANDNHLVPPLLPIYSDAACIIYAQNGKGGSRINKDPNSMAKNCNGNYRQEITFVKGVWEFYKRHAISSSRGTRSTDGILWGSISRALSSTSLPVLPTATNFSFTTATYLPEYFVTSSLKCSTIQRSSLSITASNKSLDYQSNGFYKKLNGNLRKSQPVNSY